MTTIFADSKKGVMVCDSKCTSGDEWWEDANKVVRIGDELIGFAGVATEGERWLAWHKAGQNGPAPKITNSSALILGPSGLKVLESSGATFAVDRGYMGLGSGGKMATAAFMAGADAKRAVEIACQVDNLSGGRIYVHRLKA
jgi:ATP-dependent protease HslVU (ClpYQ) peptidase subunit